MIKLAPSILSANFAKLGEEVREVEQAGADLIHVDVMDGHFVPNMTIGPLVVEALRPVTKLPLDVHLMIEQPDRYVEAFARAGADYISVHAEADRHLHRTLRFIRDLGVKPGVVINPGTSVRLIEHVLDEVDFVLVMTVNPGFGGQGFIAETLGKIKDIRAMLNARGRFGVDIEVDGGINNVTAPLVVEAGANVLVAGNAVFGREDRAKAMAELRESYGMSR